MKSLLVVLAMMLSVPAFADVKVSMKTAKDMMGRYARIFVYTSFTPEKTAICSRRHSRVELPCIFKAKMNTTGIVYEIEIGEDGQIHSLEKAHLK